MVLLTPFLLTTIALVIAIWLPMWAGFGIVTGLMVLVAVAAAFLGWRRVRRSAGPRRTISSVRDTAAALKRHGEPDQPRAALSLGSRPAPDPSTVRIPGPWTHRDVSANGIRLHIAEAGTGPLVLLLHGFPEFWWAWRSATGRAGRRRLPRRRRRPARLRRLRQAAARLRRLDAGR